MEYQGQWLCGNAARHRITVLNKKINAQAVERTIRLLEIPSSENLSYGPWMSSLVRLEQKVALTSVPAGIVTTPEALIALSRFVTTEETKPMGAIGIHDFVFKVTDANSPQLGVFENKVSAALNMIFLISPHLRGLFQELIIQLIPIEGASPDIKMRTMGSGISNHHYRGGLFLNLPVDFEFQLEEFAINIVHELGHQALMVYQYADPLFVDSPMTEVYSAIRKTMRPAIMSFHALAALSFMLEFTKSASKNAATTKAKEYFAKRHNETAFDLHAGLQAMAHVKMSELGFEMIDEMKHLSAWARSA